MDKFKRLILATTFMCASIIGLYVIYNDGFDGDAYRIIQIITVALSIAIFLNMFIFNRDSYSKETRKRILVALISIFGFMILGAIVIIAWVFLTY